MSKSPFWRAPPRQPRFLAEIAAGVALVPSFGGAVVGTCAAPCREPVGVGALGVLRGGYEIGSGFGLFAGFLTARQATSDRAVDLNLFPSPSTLRGAAQDTLELRGLLSGAWAGYTLGERVPIHFRFDLGALLGAAGDARSFTADAIRSSVAERHTATFLVAAPEVRAALPLSKRVEIEAGISVPFLFGVGRAQWSGITHGVYAGAAGYGYFGPDKFIGPVVIAIAPGVGARFDS